MTLIPDLPKIYHITHLDNLTGIISDECLWPNVAMLEKDGSYVDIGMKAVKQIRNEHPVICHPGDHVSEYVPFYFCPRSVMLYVINKGQNPDVSYQRGQEFILHLEADLQVVVKWADSEKKRWAFTLSNAAGINAEFRCDLHQLGDLDWKAIDAKYFLDEATKKKKQAEFLVRDMFPWHLIRRIGVQNEAIKSYILDIFVRVGYRPIIEVRKDWYF